MQGSNIHTSERSIRTANSSYNIAENFYILAFVPGRTFFASRAQEVWSVGLKMINGHHSSTVQAYKDGQTQLMYCNR
jgi:hypothetical protein